MFERIAMQDKAAGRIGRLRSHVQGDPTQKTLPTVDVSPTRSDEFHQQCYSFEPGRLLMNQV